VDSDGASLVAGRTAADRVADASEGVASPPPTAIAASGLSRSFGRKLAVDSIDLAIAQGEIFGLVGPDGAGKTTILRLLAALMRPTAGHATVLGYDTARRGAAIKRQIGYMAQRFSLYGDLTVHENLSFFADIYRVRGQARRERIERLLRFARLSTFRERRAAHLSGGMKKKLALACTLVHTPSVIFLDEPTTGVDPVSRREFWDILGELHAQGVTVVVSTPYMDEAERCSRVGLVYDGRLLVCDTPDRIKSEVVGELVALWPSDVRRAMTALAECSGVIELQEFGDQVRAFVSQAERDMPLMRQALQEAGVELRDMRRVRPRMEEAFVSLVRREMATDASRPAPRKG